MARPARRIDFPIRPPVLFRGPKAVSQIQAIVNHYGVQAAGAVLTLVFGWLAARWLTRLGRAAPGHAETQAGVVTLLRDRLNLAGLSIVPAA